MTVLTLTDEQVEAIRELAEPLFIDAVSQGMHTPFALNCGARGRDWSIKLADQLRGDVTPSHNQSMKPLRKIVREYIDARGVWMHELECGHTLVAPEHTRPFSRRCPFCGTHDRHD